MCASALKEEVVGGWFGKKGRGVGDVGGGGGGGENGMHYTFFCLNPSVSALSICMSVVVL